MTSTRARFARLAAAAAVILMMVPRITAAAEIKLMCSDGLKAVAEALIPEFEKTTGNKVTVTFNLAAALKQRIEAGEAFDLAILTPTAIDDLIKAGKIAANTRTVIARSGLGLAVRAGSPKPDIRTVDAFKRTLLAATSITYAKEGASGVAFAALAQKLGIADDLKPKTKLATAGAQVGDWVSSGEVQYGVLPVSEILPIKGADLVGTFPADVQSYIVMVAGVNSGASQPTPARDLIRFFMGAAAESVVKAKGMERQLGQ
jgi:molybdate transport system substrate-binding protein